MKAIKDILDYFRHLRSMGMGKWQSRIFFLTIFILGCCIGYALIIFASNTNLQQLIELKNNV